MHNSIVMFQYTLHEDWHLLDRVFEQDRPENWIATLEIMHALYG